jgi:RecA/RadA recombinase
LDRALGGGYPKGRIVEIYGPEASGKTTLALHAIAEVQKAGGMCLFVDAEHAFDASYAEVSHVWKEVFQACCNSSLGRCLLCALLAPQQHCCWLPPAVGPSTQMSRTLGGSYLDHQQTDVPSLSFGPGASLSSWPCLCGVAVMQRLGINYGDLIVCQPDHGEQAFNVMDELVRSGTVDLIVVDSVSAMVPRSEVEGDIGTPQVGVLGPRTLSPACPVLVGRGMQRELCCCAQVPVVIA